jgi:head-tail adaptor
MAKTATAVGELTERIVIQTQTPSAVSVSSITRSSTTATATTASSHGYSSGDYVTIAGAVETDYNGEVAITVTGLTTFTYAVANSPSTPATGTITATYASDSKGGNASGWTTLATVWASMEPLSAGEQLAMGGIAALGTYKSKIYWRSDVGVKQRISWTPYGFSSAKTLQIHGVQPDPIDPRRMLILTVGEVQS